MIHFENNFYCRNAMFYLAIENAHRPLQLVRRLLTGIFKKVALMNGTLTGQTARAQERDRQCVKMTCLHPFAINAIVGFSIEHGIKHSWIQQTKKELHRSITQKIVEIKRESRNEL
ncbi:uncharacterized protein LOC113005770 [Solenopsis invicta]|uniref:uncharacterized protein LOC113005770 n=1 Tax=Solenopsis invicta TaxID=13686 RepID=UPI00193D9AE0|nr:uncharacterized protein LOC113005770 [Solenopsis invicta]